MNIHNGYFYDIIRLRDTIEGVNMFGVKQKKLIIVSNEKTECYAELLLALVSMKEDKKDENEKIEAVLWSEKNYIDSKPTLGSENKIVFLGNSKIIKPISSNITFNNEFSKYGIFFGNISNKAVIYVDEKDVASDNALYDEFIRDYTNYINEIGKAYETSQKTERYLTIEDEESDRKKGTRKVLNNVGGFFNNVKNKITKKENEQKETSNETVDKVSKVVLLVPTYWPKETISKAISKSQIKDQQFRCAVLLFYLNRIKKFME